MKKNIILTIFVAAFAMTSCSLEENPLNGPSTGTFPSSAQEAQAGVLGAYKNLANSIQQYEPFPNRWIDNLTDIGATRVKLGCWSTVMTSAHTSETAVVEYEYERIYKTAGRIHLVLDNLDNLLKNGSVDENTYNQFKAELLLLRAYVYDQGCQFYGGIPFIDHALTLKDYQYPRMSRKNVTEKLMKDISDELIDALPVQWSKAEWGTLRLGRCAAYTLKARIALNWGMYEEAARCARKALDMGDGLYELTPLKTTYYPTAADGEPDQTPLFGFNAEKNSKEWMWSIPFNILAASNVHHGIYTFAPRIQNGAAGAGPSQAFIDGFQCVDGLSIIESGLYDWQNPWKNRDPRLDLYCIRPDSRVMGIECTYDCTKTTVKDYNSGAYVNNNDAYGNKSEYGTNGTTGCAGYLWRKYNDPAYYGQISGASYEDELDVPIMRFAELLLIDAEANIEMEGGDLTRAQGEINRIRARVNMPKVTVSDRDGLRSALRYERKVELCNEGFRWFDLRRWHTADSLRNGQSDLLAKALGQPLYAPAFSSKSAPLAFSNGKPAIDGNWIVTYPGTTWDDKPLNLRIHLQKVWQDRDKLWPIPYTEWTTNPLIGKEHQNPGY